MEAVTVHVEVVQKTFSKMSKLKLEPYLKSFLKTASLKNEDFVSLDFSSDQIIVDNVESITVDNCVNYIGPSLTLYSYKLHIYQLNNEGSVKEELDGEGVEAANILILPSRQLSGLWENLFYDVEIKERLLRFARTTMIFSDRGVNENKIAWNRVILLYGPPGTGKTSLCRALAHKLSIRLGYRYKHGYLIEINSHSLFSKWFSESGKLVQRMFDHIRSIVADPDTLVCVLIDEVESLTASRTSMSSTEPTDALRVVNAILTQIDAIKEYQNVIILTTSNVSGSIDLAFLDRADIKQYIGLPSQNAIYNILQGSIDELFKKNFFKEDSYNAPLSLRDLNRINFQECRLTNSALKLWKLCQFCYGLSCRSLRKIPFLAISELLSEEEYPISLDEFIIKAQTIAKKHDEFKSPVGNDRDMKNGDNLM